MLYLRFSPSLDASRLLDELQRARETLDRYQDAPDAYMGDLRRHAIALSVHYSTRIEGNTLTLEQVESLLRGRQIAAPVSQQQEALNYREAMQYAQVVANAASPRITEETVKTIHFLVTKSLPGGYNPGQYRFVQNFVINSATQRSLFRPPPPDRVQPLMEEYVQWLNTPREGLPPYYRAALAHLNFVAIHPFDDGNGRTARIVEALVLYLAGYRSQELVSLEAYFGYHDTPSALPIGLIVAMLYLRFSPSLDASRLLVAAGLLARHGTGRGIHYVPTEGVLSVGTKTLYSSGGVYKRLAIAFLISAVWALVPARARLVCGQVGHAAFQRLTLSVVLLACVHRAISRAENGRLPGARLQSGDVREELFAGVEGSCGAAVSGSLCPRLDVHAHVAAERVETLLSDDCANKLVVLGYCIAQRCLFEVKGVNAFADGVALLRILADSGDGDDLPQFCVQMTLRE